MGIEKPRLYTYPYIYSRILIILLSVSSTHLSRPSALTYPSTYPSSYPSKSSFPLFLLHFLLPFLPIFLLPCPHRLPLLRNSTTGIEPFHVLHAVGRYEVSCAHRTRVGRSASERAHNFPPLHHHLVLVTQLQANDILSVLIRMRGRWCFLPPGTLG